MGSTTLGALFTIMILSVVWKENVFFRVAEHIMVGLAAAHSMVRTVDNYLRPTLVTDIGERGQWHLILPLLFGALMYVRYIPKLSWIARYPMSTFVGYGIGYSMAFSPRPFLRQIIDTFIGVHDINKGIYLAVVLLTIGYFLYTPKWRSSSGPVRILDGWTRRILMIGFGASFGNSVQACISMLLGRVQFLFGDWLNILPK